MSIDALSSNEPINFEEQLEENEVTTEWEGREVTVSSKKKKEKTETTKEEIQEKIVQIISGNNLSNILCANHEVTLIGRVSRQKMDHDKRTKLKERL